MEPVIFKDIEGFNGRYRIGTDGTVISIRGKNKKHSILKWRTAGRVVNNKGYKPYQRVVLYLNAKPKEYQVHRLVAISFIPNLGNKPQVNHIDNNVFNNTLSNLEWATPSENVRHSYLTTNRKTDHCAKNLEGNRKHGEENGMSKLNDMWVQEIKKKYIPHVYPLSRLAREYNVSKKLILLVIQNKIWKHLSTTKIMTKQERLSRVIARGENSGHTHVIDGNATIRNENGEILIDVHEDGGAIIKHVIESDWLNGVATWTEEHADIALDKGTYKYIPQLEYDPYNEVIRAVRD